MEKTLHLTLKKKWFDMIASGEKKEEYREIKPYWISRLTLLPPGWDDIEDVKEHVKYSDFKTVTFKNGYSKDARKMILECKCITVGYGNPDWGGGNETFIIKLGKLLSTNN